MLLSKKKVYAVRFILALMMVSLIAWVPAGAQNVWAAEADTAWTDEETGDDIWEDDDDDFWDDDDDWSDDDSSGWKDEIWHQLSEDGDGLRFDRATGTITEIEFFANALVIPDKIEGISVTGISADWERCSAKTVTFPKTLKSINVPSEEFRVENVILQGKPVIGSYAFYDCRNLKSIVIPEGVTAIGEYAFLDCLDLTSITIPKSVTSIGKYALGCIDDYEAGYAHVKNFTIKGYGTNSAAAKYAKENGFKYINLGNASTPAKKAAPAKVADLKVKAGKKYMTVSWKKAKGASGYEVTYAPNKSFKSAAKTSTAKNSVKIKKLKAKKTYYVKVRAYNKVNGKKQYGKYSVVKYAKVK